MQKLVETNHHKKFMPLVVQPELFVQPCCHIVNTKMCKEKYNKHHKGL